jgi:hypothetical protein
MVVLLLPKPGLSLASISAVIAVPVRDLGRPWNRDTASGLRIDKGYE